MVLSQLYVIRLLHFFLAVTLVLIFHIPSIAQETAHNSGRKKSVEEIIQDRLKDLREAHDTADADNAKKLIAIAGTPTGQGIFRETVAIIDKNKRLICSGVLVDQFAVLTAAHCVCHGRLDTPNLGQMILFDRDIDSPFRVPIDAPRTSFFDQKPDFCERYWRNSNTTMSGNDLALVFIEKTKDQFTASNENIIIKKHFLYDNVEGKYAAQAYFLAEGYGSHGGDFIFYEEEEKK